MSEKKRKRHYFHCSAQKTYNEKSSYKTSQEQEEAEIRFPF